MEDYNGRKQNTPIKKRKRLPAEITPALEMTRLDDDHDADFIKKNVPLIIFYCPFVITTIFFLMVGLKADKLLFLKNQQQLGVYKHVSIDLRSSSVASGT